VEVALAVVVAANVAKRGVDAWNFDFVEELAQPDFPP
jgi:hypothetical protein